MDTTLFALEQQKLARIDEDVARKQRRVTGDVSKPVRPNRKLSLVRVLPLSSLSEAAAAVLATVAVGGVAMAVAKVAAGIS